MIDDDQTVLDASALLALSKQLNATALTADTAWDNLTGIFNVEQIRKRQP